jgi:TonB family protein
MTLGRTMNRLALLALCVAISCTQAPVQEQQPVPIPGHAPEAMPIQMYGPHAVLIEAPEPAPYTDVQAYGVAVRRAIRAHLIIPLNVPDSASAVYELTLSNKGAVANLRAVRRSAFPAYDAAIQRAIERAQPFPLLVTADPAEPTRMQLTFKVKE